MSTQLCDVAACVTGYAARLHAAIGARHQVASPLGAWLLLALAGPASSGSDRGTLEEILGCDVDAASHAAAALLADLHPLVASAAAVWTTPGHQFSAAFRRWQASLPADVSRGDLPDQAGLDHWAREQTFGLIDRFPVQWIPDLYLVLASALATKVSWHVPFALAPASWLGEQSAWSRQLSMVLRAPDPLPGRPPGHRQFIAATEQTGDVAVHVASAQDGLLVFPVAADPSVPALSVLAAAHRIGCAQAVGVPVQERSLSELPLGPGPAWMLREESSASERDICTAVLPAWQAVSEHELVHPDLGFAAVAHALAPEGGPWQANQAAMARYSRFGFEAAAVSAVARALSFRAPTSRRRVADLRFAHPYAVVAVTIDGNGPAPATAARRLGWHGLPVFSAWIAEPADADSDWSAADPDQSKTL